jgi:hypothetical protein
MQQLSPDQIECRVGKKGYDFEDGLIEKGKMFILDY